MEPKGYSASWSQPYTYTYTDLNSWFGSPQVQSSRELTATEREMIRIEAVDNIVQMMLTYPDAERIINSVQKRGESQ